MQREVDERCKKEAMEALSRSLKVIDFVLNHCRIKGYLLKRKTKRSPEKIKFKKRLNYLFSKLGLVFRSLYITSNLSFKFTRQIDEERHFEVPFKKNYVRFFRKPFNSGWLVYSSSCNRGTARTAIQVYAVNLTELSQGKSGSPCQTSHECKY